MSDQTFTRTPSDLAGLAARSFFYQLLSVLFRHPRAESARAFLREARSSWKQLLSRLEAPGGPLSQRLERIFTAMDSAGMERMIAEYERCFGYTANAKVPAYELEYGEEHSHRQPQELADIAAFYRAFGLQVAERSHERVDHAAVECEFLYFLLYKEICAALYDGETNADVCRDAARRFLADHPGRWLPAFALRLSRFAGEGLMKEVAEFAYEFLQADCERMGIPPGPESLEIRKVQEMEADGCISCSAGKLLDLPVQEPKNEN